MPQWPYTELSTAADTATPLPATRIAEARRREQEVRREFMRLSPNLRMRLVNERPVFEFTAGSTAAVTVPAMPAPGAATPRRTGARTPAGATLPFTAVALSFGDLGTGLGRSFARMGEALELTTEALRQTFERVVWDIGAGNEAAVRERLDPSGRPERPVPPPRFEPPREAGRLISFDDED
jgi:hypothetical protein